MGDTVNVGDSDRLNHFSEVEIELLVSGVEDFTWAIGHRCSHKSKFMALRKHSWDEICFRVNFFGNAGHDWQPNEVEQKWHSLLKTAQRKREANKARDAAISQHLPIFQLIQPLTSIERKVLYLEEEVSWGTEMNPFLADFDVKFKRAANEPEEESEDDERVSVAPNSPLHRSGTQQLGC